MSVQKKRIVFYSQHLLGVGHHFRNLQIVRALAQDHEVYFIDGGRQIQKADVSIKTIRLEPVFLDTPSGHLVPEDSSRSILGVMERRRRAIKEKIEKIRPDIFIVEFFPFGRGELRAEILPAILTARSIQACIICSLRDIPRRITTTNSSDWSLSSTGLLGRWLRILFPLGLFNDQSRRAILNARQYYDRVFSTLNEYFDYLLVHGDPKVTRLEDHFPWVDEISIPIEYTGYVSEKPNGPQGYQSGIRNGIGCKDAFVLVSAGGGLEAYELIVPCIEAWKLMAKRGAIGDRKMVIFSGPFIQEDQYKIMEEMCVGGPFHLGRFVPDFLHWMQAADFSISRSGYNTCMNILETRTRALLVPSLKMGDQDFRARKLADLGFADVIASKDLTSRRVANAIRRGLSQPPIEHNISLDGAERTNEFISKL